MRREARKTFLKLSCPTACRTRQILGQSKMASDLPLDRDLSSVPFGLRAARLRLALLRVGRDQPRMAALIVSLLILVAVLSARLQSCPAAASRCPVCEAPSTDTASAGLGAAAARALVVRSPADGDRPLSMAHVVVGVMTARRFHSTRCRMQRETWLRRARRVVFFSDGPDAVGELRTPLVAHAFEPSPTERIFAGGNWRAVPILRAMARAFFSAESQKVMGERGEPLPLWAFMCDDDSFTFTSELLATLSRFDPEQPHYLGYAFIAAPHLEGIVPGVRQPLFANGGAGIAVSRAAMRAVLPHLEKCEAEYKWNWPGDVRVAQCLLDVGVPVTCAARAPHTA